MRFKFTLDVVLRLRESLEEREYQQLEKVQFEITKTLNDIQAIDAQRGEAVQARLRALQSGMSATELQGLCAAEAGLDDHKTQKTEQLKALRLKRAERFEVYKRARLNREMLTELKSQQKEAFDQRVAHAEQKQIDDLFTSRRTRN